MEGRSCAPALPTGFWKRLCAPESLFDPRRYSAIGMVPCTQKGGQWLQSRWRKKLKARMYQLAWKQRGIHRLQLHHL